MIPDIHLLMDKANRKLFTRIISESEHPLTSKLLENRSIRSRSSWFKPHFARTVAYQNSFVKKYMWIELNGIEKLFTNDNASSISNNKARPKSISFACAKEAIMTKSRPAKPKVRIANHAEIIILLAQESPIINDSSARSLNSYLIVDL